MNKNCYLHLGFHKTATTSFQYDCFKNINLLESYDITYPIFRCSEVLINPILNHSIPIYSLFCKNPRRYHINIKCGLIDQIDQINYSYRKQLERFLEGSKNIILSGEDISLLHENGLINFIEMIKLYDYKIHIFALIRSPYQFVCSDLQEIIKNGHHNKLISLNNILPDNFDFDIPVRAHIAEKLKNTFNESIKFFNFKNASVHKYGPSGYLIDKFLKLDSSKFRYSWKNKSLFNLTVRLQNQQNEIFPSIKEGKLNPKFNPLWEEINNKFSFSGKFLLTKKEYNFIEKNIVQENNLYLETTGINFKDDDIEFANPIFGNT